MGTKKIIIFYISLLFTGRLPFHSLAEVSESWDEEARLLLEAYPHALRTRTISDQRKVFPLHLVAVNPDARRSLVVNIVRHHPMAASQSDCRGWLPLHLACEAGKGWEEGGLDVLYEAYPLAISISRSQYL